MPFRKVSPTESMSSNSSFENGLAGRRAARESRGRPWLANSVMAESHASLPSLPALSSSSLPSLPSFPSLPVARTTDAPVARSSVPSAPTSRIPRASSPPLGIRAPAATRSSAADDDRVPKAGCLSLFRCLLPRPVRREKAVASKFGGFSGAEKEGKGVKEVRGSGSLFAVAGAGNGLIVDDVPECMIGVVENERAPAPVLASSDAKPELTQSQVQVARSRGPSRLSSRLSSLGASLSSGSSLSLSRVKSACKGQKRRGTKRSEPEVAVKSILRNAGQPMSAGGVPLEEAVAGTRVGGTKKVVFKSRYAFETEDMGEIIHQLDDAEYDRTSIRFPCCYSYGISGHERWCYTLKEDPPYPR